MARRARRRLPPMDRRRQTRITLCRWSSSDERTVHDRRHRWYRFIGSRVVAKLGADGHEADAASRSTGVNTLTGEGLADALAGASVVIDVSNVQGLQDAEMLEFFETSTQNLLAAAAPGVRHYV